MRANSPVHSYYVPDFSVKIEGLTMEADVTSAVIDLTYDSNLDMADMFSMSLNNADLRFTDSPLFDVGKEVEIYMGYAGNLQPMMLGEITAVSPSFPEGGAPTLTVTGYDKSHRMRHNHKARTFQATSASLIAAQIAAENLLIPIVDPSPLIFDYKTQYCSDMAFLKEIADCTFFDVYVYWDRLYFQFPRPQTEAVSLRWGKNLSSFSPRLSTSGQVGAISVLDYDQDLAQPIAALVPVIAADYDVDAFVERLGSTITDQLTSLGTKCISGQSIGTFPDALTFAKAILAAILEGLFEGHGSCIGIPELRAGRMVDIQGVGRRFSGKYRLRKVTHTIGEGGYRTTFEVTQRNSASLLQLARRFLEDESSPNRRPQLDNTVVGKVVNNVDPKGLGRVQVVYPGLSEAILNWAKVVPPDVGTYLMPNVGDDVIVIFENGDIDRPLVTATVWNVMQTPPEAPTPANLKRVIQSRTGHRIELDETPEKGGIVLSTVKGTTVALDDQGNATIKSPVGSSITLRPDGTVSVEAAKNMTLKATGDINVEATNVNVSVAGAMDVSGLS